MSNFIQTVEADATKVWGEIVGAVDDAAVVLWNDVKPVILAVEPAVYAELKSVVVGILTAFGGGGDLASIETALLNVLEAGGTALFGTAKGLGSNILQLIIGLVKAA